jgi:hypothetical protein
MRALRASLRSAGCGAVLRLRAMAGCEWRGLSRQITIMGLPRGHTWRNVRSVRAGSMLLVRSPYRAKMEPQCSRLVSAFLLVGGSWRWVKLLFYF